MTRPHNPASHGLVLLVKQGADRHSLFFSSGSQLSGHIDLNLFILYHIHHLYMYMPF